MAERKIAWKPREENTLFGKPIERTDGIEKASGFAKYSADWNTPGTLCAKLLTSPYAQARVKSIDVSAAEKVAGVRAVYVFPRREAGYVIEWEGDPLVAVAADTPGQAADGVSAIKIDYEMLDHFVDEVDLAAAVSRGKIKPARTQEEGDWGAELKKADTQLTGFYGISTITHMCLEPHGSHCEWKDGKLDAHLSTQAVSTTANQFAGAAEIGIPQTDVTVTCDYIGGGFGSKFAADEWGIAAAVLSKKAGAPVRLMLNRATELQIAGNRPSAFAEVTLGCDADGKITTWDSHHWGSNGTAGATINQVPYVIAPKNRRVRTTGIVTNCGAARAWRAPNHPQACALTDTAIDDLAHEMEMDSYEMFLKNLDLTWKPELYAAEMEIAAKLMDWKGKWHPRGKGDAQGSVKHGVGMALHTWGGRAGNGNCTVVVHPDGMVESFAGTQDLGTGTRTCIAQILAETFGLPMSGVRVNIGSSKYPSSGPSGGSTTIGGVSGPHRRAALEALWKIFDLVAAKHKTDDATLAAVDQQIIANGKPVCSWKDACSLLGMAKLEVAGTGPKDDGLTSQQVGGVQMAHVAVDTETGIVRMVKYVAVQDIGTIVNRKLAESQVLGAMIMTIAGALTEERIMDNLTGRFINADLENYKLPRIGDIGELVVEFYEPDSEYNRGVVGLGEPPAISGIAAISNAVANAVGKRVPIVPLTPKRVLDTLRAT